MKNNTFKSLIYVFISTFFCLTNTNAQSLLKEVPLSKKIESSDLLIEGKVIAKQSFWDAEMKHIYTSNKIEVYKVFKGNSTNSIIEVFTLGGTVDLQAEKVTPSLQLQKEDIGLLFLKKSDVKHKESQKETINYLPSTGAQSFYFYDLYEGTAKGIFQKYDDVSKSLYNEIHNLTNTKYKEVNKFNVKKKVSSIHEVNKAILDITSFSPSSISAGTNSVLTITGSSFGATKGSVKFTNADTGTANTAVALDSQILTWTDSQITVEVPANAGTGNIQVVTQGGSPFNSASSLTVTYSIVNIEAEVNSVNFAFQAQHINANGNGGYNWQMHTDFEANTAAKESFIRAMNSWRCASGVYWEIDGISDVDVISRDGINIVRFDNGTELPNGTAGVCTSFYSGCSTNVGNGVEWYVEELDIVFDDATNWAYGPESPDNNEFDFESVAVHELGHGHQLGHVINTNDVMHRSISNGESLREPNSNNLAAADNDFVRSIEFTVCGQASMQGFDCSKLSIDDDLLASQIILFPSYVEKEIFISNTSSLALQEVKFFDVRGRVIKQEILKNVQKQKVNIEPLTSGLYFVQIRSENGSFSKKIIVK